MPFIGVGRHQRHHVDIHRAGGEGKNLQLCFRHVAFGHEVGLVFLPVARAHVEGGLGNEFGVFTKTLLRFDKHHPHLLGITLDVAHEGGEMVTCAGFQGDTVETVVLKTIARPAFVVVVMAHALDEQTHERGVVGMDGALAARGQVT